MRYNNKFYILVNILFVVKCTILCRNIGTTVLDTYDFSVRQNSA